jgi:hypothetical protein
LFSLVTCSLSCGNNPTRQRSDKVHPEDSAETKKRIDIENKIQEFIYQVRLAEKAVMDEIRKAEARSTRELPTQQKINLAKKGFDAQFQALNKVMTAIGTTLLHCPIEEEPTWMRALSFFKEKKENLSNLAKSTGIFSPSVQSRRHSV